VSQEDLTLLAGVLTDHALAMGEVADRLKAIGLHPTTRLKTYSTTIDKLRREPRLTLRGIDDLAGARIVRDMTLAGQDALVAQLRDLWPTAKLVDRRAAPMHGYRAVHLVPKIAGCRVEVQVRTHLQDLWAQAMESLGDQWGRGVRYGLGPLEPDRLVAGKWEHRAAFTLDLIELSDDLAGVENLDNLPRHRWNAEERVLMDELKLRMQRAVEALVRMIKAGRLEP